MRFNVKSQDFYRKQSPVKENRMDVRDMTSNPNKNRNFKCFTGWAVGSDSWAHQNATFNLFIIGVPASLLQPTLSSKTKIFNYIMSNQPTNQPTDHCFNDCILNIGNSDDTRPRFAWAKAVQWTSPTTATVGLSLTIPLSVVADLLRHKYLTLCLNVVKKALVLGKCSINPNWLEEIWGHDIEHFSLKKDAKGWNLPWF